MSASGEEALLGMIYKAVILDMNIIYKMLLLESRAATWLMLVNDMLHEL